MLHFKFIFTYYREWIEQLKVFAKLKEMYLKFDSLGQIDNNLTNKRPNVKMWEKTLLLLSFTVRYRSGFPHHTNHDIL